MTNLLITGSRISSQNAQDYTSRVVLRAKDLGWHIIVGDAEGVDTIAIYWCHLHKVPYTCYGISAHPRNNALETNYINVNEFVPGSQRKYHGYLERDDIMVWHSQRCIAIWNGVSRGTKHTFDEAIKRGLPTNVCIFRL